MSGQLVLLPQEVIDRIAAGEVVQRPVSVVKELLENSLDAGATKVVITFTPPPSNKHDSCGKVVVSDNGCGISKIDLTLAATRHATSKLRSLEDFDHLESFGFRGEALASISMVSRLNILTRTKDSPSGYTMNYVDGKPTLQNPTPRARQVGTTISVNDLFYNLKQRRPARDDYKQILEVVQKYSLLCASRGVGLACEKAGKQSSSSSSSTDLNTAMGLVVTLKNESAKESDPAKVKNLQLRATKQVIAMVYGSSLESHLKSFECQMESSEPQGERMIIYTCTGWVVLPSYALSNTKREKPQFILFINQRLVDCRPLQRALDDVYAQFSPHKVPLIFLSIEVPPTTVDVNIHPNKRECALLNQDAIVKDLSEKFRQVLQDAGQSFTVAAQPGSAPQKRPSLSSVTVVNPYKRRKSDANENEPVSTSGRNSSSNGSSIMSLSQQKSTQKPVASSKKIRTSRATQSGALEPFLCIRKEPLSQASTRTNHSSPSSVAAVPTQFSQESSASDSSSASDTKIHRLGCPLLDPTNVDLTQPGAFAAVSSQCTCNNLPILSLSANNERAATAVRLPRQALSSLRRTRPKECSYTSIKDLRREVKVKTDRDVEGQLRQAYFVGVASPHRSLVQVGEELVLLDHSEAAQELFYQLALNHFPGGAPVARIEEALDVHGVIAHFVQMEEDLRSLDSSSDLDRTLTISKTNKILAEQATACLWDKAEMLGDYFSIIFGKDDDGRIILKGLPVLLKDYSPSPHSLPLFLFRLATEVCWETEKECFRNICSELGQFYASISTDGHRAAHVRHALFPALSSLLEPSKDFVAKNGFTTITKLSKLYRVFERC